jgi:hypothetical protein
MQLEFRLLLDQVVSAKQIPLSAYPQLPPQSAWTTQYG